MAIHVITRKVVVRRHQDGTTKKHRHYQLVRTYRENGKYKTEFIASLGESPCISQDRASDLGISLDDLQKVRGLTVLADDEADWAEVARRVEQAGVPMQQNCLELIREGKKWTTLRSLRYNYPFARRRLKVPDELTEEIAASEGYDSVEDLIEGLRRLGHKLPKKMWLYDLRKPRP